MALSVVRCPACRGASHVDASALGLTVQCPRCEDTFVAIEDVEIVVPTRPSRNPTLAPPEPPRPRRRPSQYEIEPEQTDEPKPSEDHDPHRHPAGPLPASVLIGLALLPFVIPVLWLLGPVLIGEPPVLSIATAVALAISASALSLAVIYTIDWTPGTRIKGVLMLVALAYFAAVSLYFMKKEIVAKIHKVTGWNDGSDWETFHAVPGGYQVNMPGTPTAVNDPLAQPFPSVVILPLWRSFQNTPLHGSYVFTVGASPQNVPIRVRPGAPEAGSDEWFDRLTREIFKESRGKSIEEDPKLFKGFKGRELRIQIDGERVRLIQVFLIRGRVYYLAADGRGLDWNEEPAKLFFDSFLPKGAED